MSKKVKMCYISTCPSTNINSDKTFIEVPRVNPRRDQWLNAANVKTNSLGRLYCCEDHFDVHEDFTNFRHHKKYGSKLIHANLSVCPSLFLDTLPPTFPRKTRKKTRKENKLDSGINQGSPEHFHFVDVDESNEDIKPQVILHSEGYDTQCQVQEVLIKDEPTEIDIKEEMWPMLMLESHLVEEDDMVLDQQSLVSQSEDFLINTKPKSRKLRKKKVHQCKQDVIVINDSESQPSSEGNSSSNSKPPIGAPTSIWDMIDFDEPYKKAAMHFDKFQRQVSTLQVIQMSPKFYLGLPINMMHILKSVSSQEKIFPLDLLMTLTKIRLNDPFMRLSIDFGMGETRSRGIFRDTVPKLARSLANFICWSSHGDSTGFFVDIFKLEAYPNDPVLWSSSRERTLEKDVHTIKCLVCHNRAGTVSFVSDFFPNKMADIEVIAYSEILNSVPPWAELFLSSNLDLQHKKTPEGLTYLGKYMEKNGITVTKEVFLDVLYKSIGSRMFVMDVTEEKKNKVDIIDRLCEFSILRNHPKASRDVLSVMADVIKIVCALINIEHLGITP